MHLARGLSPASPRARSMDRGRPLQGLQRAVKRSYMLGPVECVIFLHVLRVRLLWLPPLVFRRNLSIPVTCKVRLLDSLEDTITMCKMLVAAGARSALTVIHDHPVKNITQDMRERYYILSVQLLPGIWESDRRCCSFTVSRPGHRRRASSRDARAVFLSGSCRHFHPRTAARFVTPAESVGNPPDRV